MKNFDFSWDNSQKLDHKKISYQNIHLGTNRFVVDKLTGTQIFGWDYKGILIDDTFISMKVLQLQND